MRRSSSTAMRRRSGTTPNTSSPIPTGSLWRYIPMRESQEPTLRSEQGLGGWLGLCDRITLMEKGKAAVRFRSGVEIEVEN